MSDDWICLGTWESCPTLSKSVYLVLSCSNSLLVLTGTIFHFPSTTHTHLLFICTNQYFSALLPACTWVGFMNLTHVYTLQHSPLQDVGSRPAPPSPRWTWRTWCFASSIFFIPLNHFEERVLQGLWVFQPLCIDDAFVDVIMSL